MTVIPSLGQIYNGEYVKGASLLAGSTLAVTLSYTLVQRNNTNTPIFDFKESEDDKILYFLGGLAYVGALTWSARDAYISAKRLSLTPVISPRQISGRLSYAF